MVVIVIWPASIGEFFPGEMAALPTLAEIYDKAGAKVVFLFLPQDNLARRSGDDSRTRGKRHQIEEAEAPHR